MTPFRTVALTACLALSACGVPRPAPHPSASVPTPPVRRTRSRTPLPAPHCRAAQLRLSPGARPSPRTQEARQRYELTNGSTRRCTLHGYPQVTLFDARGRRLPFAFRRRAERTLGDAPAVTVVIRPRRSAHFEIYRSTCVTREGVPAARLAVRLPGGGRLGAVGVGRRALVIGYCPGDPGGREPVSVSPVESG